MAYFIESNKSTRTQLQEWHVQTQAGGAIALNSNRTAYAQSLSADCQQAAFSVSTGIPALASQPLPSPLSRLRQWPGWVTAKASVKPVLIFFGKELFRLAVTYVIGGQHNSAHDASVPTA